MTPTQYRTELNRLENGNYLDWYSPAPHTYEQTVGDLRLQLKVVPQGRTAWEIRKGSEDFAQCTVVSSGDSDSATVAMRECLMYAHHYVRNVITPAQCLQA